ncbi:hypothetical protein ABID08_000723 [Rhizobium binae]|uniref:Uncharacterized protein n=1 Tax=Rhizobium binae TaxID=1138190 RepID=A0ABV2MA89_9HYPH|nr:hypothetical protein [Rhizobium binae]MBX4992292.1 hypothetical protein [Rhizobium binae]NKL52431.1 hypothetical protein [Rhizobium leguminosarum bv. viciae]QSY80741.1 hypothetical protein J2J99_13550 [Rhizobium binae]
MVEQTLFAFLAAQERKAWDAATLNCMLFPAAWAIWLGHRDPVENWRGAFASENEYLAIVRAAGGCVPLMEKAAERINARRLMVPVCGAVGVIGSHTNFDRQFGAIFDGRRWLVRFTNRIGSMAARPLAIWSI